ncbi:MAG: hypothetical protein ABSE51_06130 [Terracidiphilus sp.]
MIQPTRKSQWLLVMSGIFCATSSLMTFSMLGSDGSVILRSLVQSRDTMAQMGMCALAAGLCTIVCGIWSLRIGNSWLLILNGLSCAVLGLLVTIGATTTRPTAFRSLAPMIVVMAASIGAYELAAARTLRDKPADEWLLGAAGMISAGLAVVFLAFVFRWIKLEASPSGQTFQSLGSYFGFSALCMVGLVLRPPRPQAVTLHLADTAG